MRSRVVLPALALAACSVTGTADDGRPAVVTTVSPITNLVQNIGGGQVRLTGIVPEGTNSHTFQPAPTDARAMAEADIVFANGLHLEVPTLELAEANTREGVPIVRLGERTIEPDEYIYDFSFPRSVGDPNPHLWTNPPYVKRYAEIVADELARLDPAHAGEFEENLAAFSDRLDALTAAIRSATGTVPHSDRRLLTYHDSFPYFAREFGWEVIGAIQPSDFSEPTPREVGDLIEQIEETGVPAIFGSEVFASPVLEQIARETGARYVDDLRDDDLPGEPGDREHSYLGLMAFDLKAIIEALGGDASAVEGVDVSNLSDGADVEYPQ